MVIILNKNCIICHGGVRQKGGFSLLFRDEALATLKSGKHAIIPGDPDHSEMIRRISLSDPEERMHRVGLHADADDDQARLRRRGLHRGVDDARHADRIELHERLEAAAGPTEPGIPTIAIAPAAASARQPTRNRRAARWLRCTPSP